MVSIETFRELAMSFPNATEEPHFEKTSFRINKKIFATFDEKKKRWKGEFLFLQKLSPSIYLRVFLPWPKVFWFFQIKFWI
mgnify:CR=1 FL=1